jgi:hypothetical protein
VLDPSEARALLDSIAIAAASVPGVFYLQRKVLNSQDSWRKDRVMFKGLGELSSTPAPPERRGFRSSAASSGFRPKKTDALSHEIAAPQLAVDGKVEEREVAPTRLKLKSNADCPDFFGAQRALLTNEAALVPWVFGKADKCRDRSGHGLP